MHQKIKHYSINISPEHLALLIELWIRTGVAFPHGITDHSIIRLALENLISRGDLRTLREFLLRSRLQEHAEIFEKIYRMATVLPVTYDATAFAARYHSNAAFDYIDGPSGAEALIVIFTGHAQRMGFPLPLVHGLFLETHCPILYLKDKTRNVFLNGLGDSGGRAGLIARIQEKMKQLGVQRSILIGASSGTFAALTYAPLLATSHLMGLAGPTRIDYGDTRPHAQRLRDMISAAGQSLDPVAELGDSETCHIRYYYGEQHPRDTDYAKHLAHSGAGEAVAVRGNANHVVLDVISEMGFFQADLAAAVAGKAFTDPSIYPALFQPFKATPCL